MRIGLTPLDTALELLRRGLWPVPLHPPGAIIQTRDGPKTAKGKEPIAQGWGRTRPTEADLRRMYDRHPDAGVGVMLGPAAGVIDVEVDGPEGEASLLRLCGGVVPETLGWSSRRGPHRLFAWDNRLAGIDPLRRAKVALPELPGLEFRFGQGRQAQSACPPTLGEDGQPRRWNDCDTIASLPEAALQFLTDALAKPKRAGPHEANGAAHGPRGASANEPAAAWFRKALENEAGKVATARESKRHETLLAAAKTLGGMLHHGYLTESEVTEELTHAGRRAGLPDLEVAETISDGLAYGKATPLPWPEKLGRPGGASRNGKAGPSAGGPSVEPTDNGDDDTPLPPPRWPAPLGEAAYHGLAGEAFRLIAEHTEADLAGILTQLLVAFGSAVGRGPHTLVEGTRHGVNEFVVQVGETAAARKGTSRARALAFLEDADPEWLRQRVRSGLSSGEGLITPVRDPVWTKQPIKEKGRVVGHQDVMADEGESDKRLLIREGEFGSVLRALEREGNRLSALLRSAWDGESLATMTKSPLRATDPHISLIGHITFRELQALLSEIDIANGLANRVLWLCVRRTKFIPLGGSDVDLAVIRARFRTALGFAKGVGRMSLTRAARAVYSDHYARLSSPPPGVLGDVTNRATAHALRWSMLYALADLSGMVRDDHMRAALAVIDAANRAAAHIFGDSLGYPDAEKTLAALRATPAGMTRTEVLHVVFQRNAKAERIRNALAFLVHHGLAREERDTGTGGRPAFRYHSNDINDLDDERPDRARHEAGDTSFKSSKSSTPERNGQEPKPPAAERVTRRRVRL
jgi:hypothetical protein